MLPENSLRIPMEKESEQTEITIGDPMVGGQRRTPSYFPGENIETEKPRNPNEKKE
jgi:hypothetical protein